MKRKKIFSITIAWLSGISAAMCNITNADTPPNIFRVDLRRYPPLTPALLGVPNPKDAERYLAIMLRQNRDDLSESQAAERRALNAQFYSKPNMQFLVNVLMLRRTFDISFGASFDAQSTNAQSVFQVPLDKLPLAARPHVETYLRLCSKRSIVIEGLSASAVTEMNNVWKITP